MCFELTVLVAVVIAMRVGPRLARPRVVPGSDAFAHLGMGRYFHEHRRPQPWTWMGLHGTGYYPFLYHMLLGLGGERYRRVAEVVMSALCDALAVAAIYLFAHAAVAGAEWQGFAFWLALLYGTSPVFFQRKTGPRSFEGTPRALGETLFLLMALAALSPGFGLMPGWVGLTLAVALGAAMLLASKFSLQALVLLCAAAAVMANRADVLLLPLVVMASALILSGGAYWHILRLQVQHLVYYAREVQQTYEQVKDRNRPVRIARKLAEAWRKRRWRRMMGIVATDFTPTALVFRCPQFVLALLVVLGAFGACAPPASLDAPVFRVWFWAAVAPLVLTSFYPFLFIGEAERYQNYSLLPQYIFLTAWLWRHDACGLGLAVQLGAYACYAGWFVCLLLKASPRQESLAAVVDFIQATYGEARVVPVWKGATHDIEYALGEGRVFPNMTQFDIDWYFVRFYVHPDKLERALREGGARLIVIERAAERAMAEEHGKPYDFSPWPDEVYSNDHFRVLDAGASNT